MIVGTLRLRLYIRGSRSLKEKRHALRKIKDKVKHHFNVSIAEIDHLDDWKSAIIGVATVGNDRRVIESALGKVENTIARLHVGEIIDRQCVIEPVSQTFQDSSEFPESPESLETTDDLD